MVTDKIHSLISFISQAISDTIKTLLQEKHLYQSIKIQHEHLIDPKGEKNLVDGTAVVKAADAFKKRWYFSEEEKVVRREYQATMIFIKLPTIKIYCEICKRIEPFNPGPFPCKTEENVLDDLTKFSQLFTFHFQCQSCHREITSFLVKQNKDKLQIVGRTPIEYVEVKEYFPKAQKKYISDAIVAHQSGQTLAGLFFLRVFIEQFCVSKVDGELSRVDEIIKDYDNGLPGEFKARFASLYSVYGKLSDAIHKANASQELFRTALSKLEKHYDAKRLYELS